MAKLLTIQAAPLLSSVLWFLGLLVWPVFLWFFTKRPDVRQHIGALLDILARVRTLKLKGVTVTIEKPQIVEELPEREQERISLTPPKPPFLLKQGTPKEEE